MKNLEIKSQTDGTRHTAEFVKRKAKIIKKSKGITHIEALNQAVQELGFSDWNAFIAYGKTLTKLD